MKVRSSIPMLGLALVLARCAPAPSGADASSDTGVVGDSSAATDPGVAQESAPANSVVGTWVYTSGANEQRLNFLGDGRYEMSSAFTSASSGCKSETTYMGRYTLMGDALSGTAASASSEVTDCMDMGMNRPAMDITDAMQIARGNLDGTVMVSGDRLTRMYDSGGTPTTREYMRGM